jgi:uncharacterized membrane protein
VKKQKCQICKKEFLESSLFPLGIFHNSLKNLCKSKNKDLDLQGFICEDDLKNLRTKRMEEILKENKGELTKLEKKLVKNINEHDFIASNINKKFERQLTFGEKIADKMALFGGSWKFILSFLAFLVVWMIINTFIILENTFDPYPFILLNLFLSCIAAIQAPLILMSQNRQSEKDTLQSEDDYLTNLKAELEIRQIHSKLDHLMKNHWNRLIEIQEMQLEMMHNIFELKNKKAHDKN